MKVSLGSFKKNYLSLFLILFSCSFSFSFDDESRNTLLIGFMVLSSSTLIFYRLLVLSDVFLLSFVLCLVSFTVFIHDVEPRWSTILYTCLFSFSFLAFLRAFNVSQFSHSDFISLLKFLIYAYTAVLIIQQISVLLGLTPFNLRNYDPSNPFKLNSLGAEPSWSGRIIAILFYCYLTVKERCSLTTRTFSQAFREDKIIWIAFFWSMITMISGTAIVFLGIVLLKFVKRKKLLYIIPTFFILIVIAEATSFTPYERSRDVAFATVTFDEQQIIQADQSAAFRIVPLLVLSKSVNISTFEGFFGHGVDSIERNLDFGLGTGGSASTMVALWYEYGFFSFILFIILSLRLSIDVKEPTSFVFWFMLIFLYPINTQIPWLAMILLYMTKYYSNQKTVTNTII